MAESKSVVSRINFCFEIPRVSKLDEVWSPEFMVQGIPWEIKFRKENKEAKEFLGIFLHCVKKDQPPHWTHAASAFVKLLSFSDTQNAIERNLGPYVFDGTEFGYGDTEFIGWDNLFVAENDYVKDDTIKFKIGIQAEPFQNQINRSELILETLGKSGANCCQTKFRLTLSNIKHFMAVRTDSFVLCDLPWDLTVYKDHSSNLSVRSQRIQSPNLTPCKTKMAVKLLSKKVNMKPIEQIQIKNIGSLQTIETNNFLSWDQLFKSENGFVENNSITLEVEMKGDINSSESDSVVEVNRQKMECSICFESIVNQNISCPPCGHIFCTSCIINTVNDRKICPLCNAEVTLNDLHRVYLPL